MRNTYLRPGGDGLLGGGLGTSFVSEVGSKIGLNKGYRGRTLVDLERDTDVEALGQEYVM